MAESTIIPSRCDVKVVLLCKGRGADASSYRPHRDESQWWCRRDALVRCVSSFLFGAVEPSDNNRQSRLKRRKGNTSEVEDATRKPSNKIRPRSEHDCHDQNINVRENRRELVLLFDEDLSRMHMSFTTLKETHNDNNTTIKGSSNVFPSRLSSTNKIIIPKEQTIISIWKQAAQNPFKTITNNGFSCRLEIDRHNNTNLPDNTNNNRSKSSPNSEKLSVGNNTTTSSSKLESKRDVLVYLQEICSIEFLRKHHLNNRPENILRKTNKKELLKICDEWEEDKKQKQKQQRLQQQSRVDSKNGSTITTSNDGGDEVEQERKARIETIYTDLLKSKHTNKLFGTTNSNTAESTEVIAGTLHEDFEELPCFGYNEADSDCGIEGSNLTRRLQLCLFLGAVRDMHSFEYEALNRACENANIPVVGIRLGTVPEFTSKILSILAFHHANGVLGSAIQRLATNPQVDIGSSALVNTTAMAPPSCLHVVALVPLTSNKLSTDLKDRDRVHWNLVRLVVCTLWRSRLASSSTSSSSSSSVHTNTLTLIFSDRLVVNLNESDFVNALAEQHQAAPCEFQILTALKGKVENEVSSTSSPWSSKTKKFALQVLTRITSASKIPVTSTIPITTSNSKGIGVEGGNLIDPFYFHDDGEIHIHKDGTSTSSAASTNPVSMKQHHRHHSVVTIIYMDENSPEGKTMMGNSQHESKNNERGNGEKQQLGEDARNGGLVEAFIRASKKLDIPVMRQPQIVSQCDDWIAATIVALQHFCYQNRLFLPFPKASPGQTYTSKKRKRDKNSQGKSSG